MTPPDAMREAVREACAGDDLERAQEVIFNTLTAEPGAALRQFVANQAVKMATRLALPELRLSCLSSFTAATLEPHLALEEFLNGHRLVFQSIPYQQWDGALAAAGELDEFAPQVIFLLLHLEDVAPLLARRHLAAGQNLDSEADGLIAAIASSLDAYRERCETPVILSTFVAAARGIERHFDRRVSPSRQGSIDALNARLGELATGRRNVLVFDYAQTVTDFGRLGWFDGIKDDQYMTPLTASALGHLAGELAGFLKVLMSSRRKVLAVDADNTLWAGIVGEDGPQGIALDGEYPGNAFAHFQEFLANLSASGIALAVVSKNNLADVEEVFAEHPELALKWSDFAAHFVNWEDKTANLRALAAELNVATDALTFVDDSPYECGLVRTQAAEIAVVEMTGSPSLFAARVLAGGGFLTPGLTAEDRGRSSSYVAERERRQGSAQAGSRAEFLAGLGLELSLGQPEESEIDRVVQLFGRTNQFNLTTKRYSHADVSTMLRDNTVDLTVARLSDRFGNYGLIGITVAANQDGETIEIESFLMSCRIIGRNVEDALLAALEGKARGGGCKRLLGKYAETKKNGLVADFYRQRGFVASDSPGTFIRDLATSKALEWPPHIELKDGKPA